MYPVPDIDDVVAVAKALGDTPGSRGSRPVPKVPPGTATSLRHLRAGASGGAPAADGLSYPDTRVSAEARRGPTERLDVEMPD